MPVIYRFKELNKDLMTFIVAFDDTGQRVCSLNL